MGGRGRKAGAADAAIGHLPGIDTASERGARESKSKKRGKKGPAETVPWQLRALYFVGRWFGVGIESAALGVLGLIAILFLLSHFAETYTGKSLAENVLPLAGTILALCMVSAIFLKIWFSLRRLLARLGLVGRHLPTVLAITLAASAAYAWINGPARDNVRQLQTLVGGTAEAERSALAHQVFAHYRRSDLDEVRVILERGMVYDATVREAAEAFGVSYEILMGIAATESSFYPRPSNDGGRGLFQITKPPSEAVEAAKKALGKTTLDPVNQRHNTFVGAATFQHYYEQMGRDLFLALLAYNIGPHNGGLRSIMRQYGAVDFVTIQPYLKHLPRDYPIRVLAAALAYRVWSTLDGELPRYEENMNARDIQNIGVPGLEPASGLPEIVVGRAD